MRNLRKLIFVVTVLAFAIYPGLAWGQGSALLFYPATDQSGNKLSFANIQFCSIPATVNFLGVCQTPITVFKDQALTQPYGSAIQTDGVGNFPPNLVTLTSLWFTPGTYCYTVTVANMISPATNPCIPFSVAIAAGTSPIFAGLTVTGTATINTLGVTGAATVGSLAVTGAATAASVGSTTANAASSGFERLATTDQDCWRNAANGADVCTSDAGAAAAGTGNLADLLKWGGGGFQGGAFVDKSAAPAQSGVERTGNNVCAVASRNAAASGDVCAAQVDASNVTNLGGSSGVKVAGPINANSQAIQNGVLTGAGSGNAVTLLNFQGPASAIVGNSADQTVYTFTIPANTIAAAKGVRVRSGVKHTTGAASVTYKIFFGATAAFGAGRGDSGTALDVYQVEAFNTTAQTAQALIYTDWFGNTTAPGVIFNTSAENTANAVVVKLTFNVANTDQVTPEFFIVELIQ